MALWVSVSVLVYALPLSAPGAAVQPQHAPCLWNRLQHKPRWLDAPFSVLTLRAPSPAPGVPCGSRVENREAGGRETAFGFRPRRRARTRTVHERAS
ncbi:MAG: hypothetical protein ACPIOQ_55065, partial [Promethearchaeia archaeon]